MTATPPAAYSDLARQFRQQRFNPLSTLTPALMTSYLDQFEAGYLRGAALAWREIAERDDTAFAAITKRLARVSRRKWDVVIGEEVADEDQAAAQAQQQFLKQVFSRLVCREATDTDEVGGLRMVFEKIAAARLNRYALLESQVDFSGDVPAVTLWHVPLEFFENTTGVMRYCGPSGVSNGRTISRENWIVAKDRWAFMKAVSVAYMFKRLPLADWLNYSELFGIPGLHQETNAAKGSAEWDAAANALAAFANDFKLLTSVGEKLNVIQPGGSGQTPSKELVDRMDRAIARLILGSDLATLSRENGTGASMQGDEMDELTASDCEFVSEALNEQLAKKLIAWRFGEDAPLLAYLQITPPANEDAKLDMQIDEHVVKHGVVLDPADVAERYNRTDASQDGGAGTPARNAPASEAGRSARAPLQAENESRAARLEAARRKQLLKQLQAGVKADLKPLASALESVLAANTEDEARAALLALSTNLPQLSQDVLAGNAATDAMTACVASEFLAGLASLKNS